jgi:hypothetical protein
LFRPFATKRCGRKKKDNVICPPKALLDLREDGIAHRESLLIDPHIDAPLLNYLGQCLYNVGVGVGIAKEDTRLPLACIDQESRQRVLDCGQNSGFWSPPIDCLSNQCGYGSW